MGLQIPGILILSDGPQSNLIFFGPFELLHPRNAVFDLLSTVLYRHALIFFHLEMDCANASAIA